MLSGALITAAAGPTGRPRTADLQQRIGQPLSGRPVVALARLGKWLERGPDDRASVRRHLAFDPDQAVARLADPQVASFVRPVGLRERAFGVDLMLEVLGHA